jgi:predicted HicB family RNase H-like nuclease
MVLKNIITFQGKSLNELEKAFHDSIDDYLTWYAEKRIIASNKYDAISKEL